MIFTVRYNFWVRVRDLLCFHWYAQIGIYFASTSMLKYVVAALTLVTNCRNLISITRKTVNTKRTPAPHSYHEKNSCITRLTRKGHLHHTVIKKWTHAPHGYQEEDSCTTRLTRKGHLHHTVIKKSTPVPYG